MTSFGALALACKLGKWFCMREAEAEAEAELIGEEKSGEKRRDCGSSALGIGVGIATGRGVGFVQVASSVNASQKALCVIKLSLLHAKVLVR